MSMDVKKFREIKRKQQLASQPVVQPNPDLGVRSELQPELVVQPPQSLELVDRTKPKSEPELQLSPEPVGYLESVAMIEREESIESI